MKHTFNSEFCLSHCSNILVQSSFVYLTQICNFNLDTINKYLKLYYNSPAFESSKNIDSNHIDLSLKMELY